ncbi:MAG TPA: glycosyltransferase [Candidatus Bathyarchaeia archaeon]|nr:glycosyltransferase [Candidatus Bathyarchaeia archaeon]
MRIGVVVHGYPPAEAAGVELVAKEQADALVARGHQVRVFARAYRPDLAQGTWYDESVDGVPVRRVVNHYPVRPLFHEYHDNHDFDDAFRAWLDESPPDVLHAQHLILFSPNLLVVARERGIPIVLSLHDFYYLCHRIFLIDDRGARCPGPDAGSRCVPCLAEHGAGESVKYRFDYMARMLELPDAIVAPSRALAARYAEELPFLDGRIAVIEPGLARVPARPAAPERAQAAVTTPAGQVGKPLRLLFVGTLLHHKGPDLLISALAAIDPRRWTLDVYGATVAWHEAYVDGLRALARDLPVAFHGTFPPDELAAVLGRADVLVVASRCDESYSRTIREARAAGLAVVAPRTGGPGEALHDGIDGLLVAPDSVPELRAALVRLLDEPELTRALQDAPARVATVAAAAGELEALYTRLVAGAAPESGRPSAARRSGRVPRVSVAYVTKNGAAHLDESLAAVRAQKGAFELVEVIAVDSGSSDRTLEILARHGVRTLRVPAADFGHGRTRNLAGHAATGDIVVFLTQDASPADEGWLEALLDALASDPLLAGVWSRHLPRLGCHPMEWRMLSEFPLFQSEELRVAAKRGNPDYAAHPEAYYWFSNNSSAIRKSVLERWPFPEIEFAEDQAWARAVLGAGWRTALVPRSRIYHSHAYSPWANLKRNFDHARAMRDDLGQSDDLTLADCLRFALRESRRDVAFWASYRRRTRLRVAARWGLPATAYHLGAFTGRWLGSRAHALPRTLAEQLSFQSGVRNAG